jgi:hypothetical protein
MLSDTGILSKVVDEKVAAVIGMSWLKPSGDVHSHCPLGHKR